MTTQEYIRQLNSFKRDFGHYARYNIESPQRIQSDIQQAINFLEDVKVTGELKKRVVRAIGQLQQALQNAQIVSRQIKPDPADKDLGAIIDDDSFWYQQVVGAAEGAMDTAVHYLEDRE